MLVQRVLMPGSGRESWTLLGDDGEVVEPAERYLAYLTAVRAGRLSNARTCRCRPAAGRSGTAHRDGVRHQQ